MPESPGSLLASPVQLTPDVLRGRESRLRQGELNMRLVSILATAATVALLAGCDEVVTQPTAVPSVVARAPVATAINQGFEATLNAFRTQNGLQPATFNASLAAAAQLHAEDMAANGYFDHRSLDGRTYAQRISGQGYRSCWPVENLAWGQRDAARAVTEWAGSPGHRRNMMLQGRVEYGLGQAGNVYVLDLARVC